MTFGLLAVIIVAVAVVLFFGGGAIFQRYENGHWGRTRSYFETDLVEAGRVVLLGAFLTLIMVTGATLLGGLLLRLAGVEVL